MKIVNAFIAIILFLAICAFAQDQEPCTEGTCLQDQRPSDILPGQADQNMPPNRNLQGAPVQAPNKITEGSTRTTGQEPEFRRNQEQTLCPGPSCPQLAPERKTEFQKFVYTMTGEKLSIFGRNLFDRVPTTFAPVDHVPVPADYVIGPGDEILVRTWGQLDLNARVTVDRNGQIFLPKVGAVTVAGVRSDQLTQSLRSSIGRVFKNFDLNVTLGQLRSIQVLVVGQARRPGTYTVSSLSTLVNALFASGGPSVSGSMRDIQLKRHGQVVVDFDVYDLLVKGDQSKDIPLLPGDVIYIPPVGPQVAVFGSVNVPGIYEINKSTSIQEQIDAAGGLSATADGSRLMLERIDDRKSMDVTEIKFDQASLSQTLHDGDMLRVFPISPQVENAVVLRGNVAVSGRFPWHENMRITDLIPTREAVITRDYWMRQNALARVQPGWPSPFSADRQQRRDSQDQTQGQDQNQYQDQDQLRIQQQEDRPDSNLDFTRAQQGGDARPSINRLNVQRSAAEQWNDGLLTTTRTTLSHNQAAVNWDYAVIQRLNHQDLTTDLIAFNLGKAISDPQSADNLRLESGDVITIFSQSDLAVPTERRTKFVSVTGEVNFAGVYRVQKGETLRDVLRRAGGLTSKAYLYAADFRRQSVRQDQQQRLEQAVDEMEKQLRSRAVSLSNSGTGTPEERLAAQEQVQADQRILDRLRQEKATGRIVLDLKPTDTNINDLPAIELQDGDQITIPPQPETVAVIGAVYNQSSFVFHDGTTLKDYLTHAGGPTRDSDRDRIFVIRADGSVVSAQMRRAMWSGGFESLKMMPGDTAVVPERFRTTSALKELKDWSQVFTQFALGAAAVQVLRQ